MEQLQQEQQFNNSVCECKKPDSGKLSITIHNPNTKEQTAKYLAKLILQGLEDKNYGDGV